MKLPEQMEKMVLRIAEAMTGAVMEHAVRMGGGKGFQKLRCAVSGAVIGPNESIRNVFCYFVSKSIIVE